MQHQIIEHLREYIAEIQGEERWKQLYQSHRPQLEESARLAKQQLAKDLASSTKLHVSKNEG